MPLSTDFVSYYKLTLLMCVDQFLHHAIRWSESRVGLNRGRLPSLIDAEKHQ